MTTTLATHVALCENGIQRSPAEPVGALALPCESGLGPRHLAGPAGRRLADVAGRAREHGGAGDHQHDVQDRARAFGGRAVLAEPAASDRRGRWRVDVRWGPRLLSLVVTIFGIVLFGTLIGTISTVDAAAPRDAESRADDRAGSRARRDPRVVAVGRTARSAICRGGRQAPAPDDRDPRRRGSGERGGVAAPTIGDRRGLRLICRNGIRRSPRSCTGSVCGRLDLWSRSARRIQPRTRRGRRRACVGVACDGFTDKIVVAEVDDPAAAQTLTDACAGAGRGRRRRRDRATCWRCGWPWPGAAEWCAQLLSNRRCAVDLQRAAGGRRGGRSRSVSGSVDNALAIGDPDRPTAPSR